VTRTSPYEIDLSDFEQVVLEQQARCYSAPHRQVVRANIVLLAADGWANVDIAYELGTHVDVVSKWACEPPSKRDVPLSRWSSSELVGQAVTEGLVDGLSASTVRRWLAEDAIRPWQYWSWIFPRDPDFATKAARVLDLYQRVWHGDDLGPHD
jgi:hypothetical protein